MSPTAAPGTLIRRIRRRARELVPPDRRVKPLGNAHGRWRLQVRKLTAPYLQRPVRLRSRDGMVVELSVDPVDELVANDLLGRNRDLWFPEAPEGTIPLAEPEVVLDLGAHHGFFSVAVPARFPTARVVAVEPSGSGVARIARNADLNGLSEKVRIVQAALADEPGWGALRHTDEGSWGSSLFEEPDHRLRRTELVRLATLDEILAGERPAFVKCNAEGAEFALVRQIVASDLRPDLLVVMVHPEFGDLDATVASLEAVGYLVRRAGWEHRPVLHAFRREPTPDRQDDIPEPANHP